MAKTAGFAVAYGASADTVLARIRAGGGVAELIDVENMLENRRIATRFTTSTPPTTWSS